MPLPWYSCCSDWWSQQDQPRRKQQSAVSAHRHWEEGQQLLSESLQPFNTGISLEIFYLWPQISHHSLKMLRFAMWKKSPSPSSSSSSSAYSLDKRNGINASWKSLHLQCPEQLMLKGSGMLGCHSLVFLFYIRHGYNEKETLSYLKSTKKHDGNVLWRSQVFGTICGKFRLGGGVAVITNAWVIMNKCKVTVVIIL